MIPEIEVVVACMLNGQTGREIGQQYGCSANSISVLLRTHNLDSRRLHELYMTQRVGELASGTVYSNSEIAEILDVHPLTVRHYIGPFREQRRKTSDLVVQLYKEGKTRKEIAEIVGVQRPHVGRILIDHGFRVRVKRHGVSDLILKLHEEGHTPSRIAELTNCALPYVYKVLKRHEG